MTLQADHTLALFAAELILLLLTGRLLGEVMNRFGQPALFGQLIAGVVLGPSVFGLLWPQAHHFIFPADNKTLKTMIDAISQIGILLLLLLTGMETNLALVRRRKRAVIASSLSGIAVPFALGVAVAYALPSGAIPMHENRLVTALFLGTALSISSVKIVAMVLIDIGAMRRDLGQLILATAILDDTIAWIIIAVIAGIAAHGTIDIPTIGASLAGTALFLAFSLTVGQRLVARIIVWVNDHMTIDVPVITAIIVIMLTMSLTTELIGVHTALGAFIAGILVGKSPILTRQIDERLRGLIASLFMPVFFGLAGLSADLTVLRDPSLLLLTIALILIASIGKFGGAFAGGALGGLTRQESYALASGMNARGSTEVIIATIGLSMGVLSQNMFSMIVTMAILTTMAMPPMLRAALSRLPLGKDEKARLEREEFEQNGFVANLERLLLAADESPNAKFASHIAGLIAGGRGLPITVLHVGARAKKQEDKREDEESLEAAVKNAAKAVAEADEEKIRDVEVTTRVRTDKVADAVAEEAEKGFDLLLIGMEKVLGDKDGFDRKIENLADGFKGPIAIVAAKGVHLEQAAKADFKILVPVSGSAVSRRGAEVAVALARLSPAAVNVVYVSTTRDRGVRRKGASMTLAREEAILKDTAAAAARYDVEVVTSMRANAAPEEAILREIKSAGADLVVLGVDRIQGDSLNFGSVATAILAKSDVSVLLIAGGESAKGG